MAPHGIEKNMKYFNMPKPSFLSIEKGARVMPGVSPLLLGNDGLANRNIDMFTGTRNNYYWVEWQGKFLGDLLSEFRMPSWVNIWSTRLLIVAH